jgi:hypothetical protein
MKQLANGAARKRNITQMEQRINEAARTWSSEQMRNSAKKEPRENELAR